MTPALGSMCLDRIVTFRDANYLIYSLVTLVRKCHADLDGSGKVSAVRIADVDFPRTIYDRPLVNLGLFPEDLAGVISELYRWINILNHKKRRANRFALRLEQIISQSGLEYILTSNSRLASVLATGFIKVVEGYLDTLKRIGKLSQEALDGLKISKIDETKVQAERVITEEDKQRRNMTEITTDPVDRLHLYVTYIGVKEFDLYICRLKFGKEIPNQPRTLEILK